MIVSDLRDPIYGRAPTEAEVKQFARAFKNPRTRRYEPWCSDKGINQALLKDRLNELENKGANILLWVNKSPRAFSKEAIDKKLREQDGKCACCGASLANDTPYGDHIIPYSRGGVTQKWNLQVLCLNCNSSKSNKDPMLWAFRNGVQFSDEFVKKYYKYAVDKLGQERVWRF